MDKISKVDVKSLFVNNELGRQQKTNRLCGNNGLSRVDKADLVSSRRKVNVCK
jgi:hypothetical protein